MSEAMALPAPALIPAAIAEGLPGAPEQVEAILAALEPTARRRTPADHLPLTTFR